LLFFGEENMPIYKPRLSRPEEAMKLDYLRQLQFEGLDVEIPEEWQENSRVLDIVTAGPAESTVFESASGGVCYAVLTRLVAERSGSILTDWALSTDYDEQIVPESFDDRDPVWILGGQVYRQGEVLNHLIENGLRLSRGKMVEAWLLATGLGPIPAHYRNLSVARFQLSFWDQFGREFSANGSLSVLRKVQRDDTRVRRGTGLNGMDQTGKPRELSVSEESRRRYLELVAQEKKQSQHKVAGLPMW
jgi:hypothetical protein